MSLPRSLRITLAGTGLLISALALAALVLLNLDWNRLRPWVNARASGALGRPFEVRGALELHWQPGRGDGWRAALPRPQLLARDVHLGNPAALVAAGAPPEMGSAQTLTLALELLPLLERQLSVSSLGFEQARLHLLQLPGASPNWLLAPAPASAWRLRIHNLAFSHGQLRYTDQYRGIEALAAVDTAEPGSSYGVRWSLTGQWQGQAVEGSGRAGALLALQQALPYPVAAELRVGSTRIALEGTLSNPAALAALDLQLAVSGASMARLYGLSGLLLPETPAFRTAGRLRATLGPHSRFVYAPFSGKVGASDIGGQLEWRSATPRPLLRATVHSNLLQLADLAPLIGADSNASKRAREVAPVQPGNKVLPVEPFRPERWTSLDAELSFTGKQIVREHALPLRNLSAELRLKDGVLTLAPLRFEVAGGQVQGKVRLDGSASEGLQASLEAQARQLQLRQLLPALEGVPASVGALNGRLTLAARGESVAALLGAADGEVSAVINEGSVSKLLLEKMGLNFGSVVLTTMLGDHPVRLNCLVSDFSFQHGIMRSRSVVADTEDATIGVAGSVDLARERLDLTLKPDSKGLRLLSLRAPLYVRGSFQHPELSVDKRVLALRAGGALALAALAPVAALAPLISLTGEASPGCAQLLATARAAERARR